MLPSELVPLNPCSKDREMNRFTLEQDQFQSHFWGGPDCKFMLLKWGEGWGCVG